MATLEELVAGKALDYVIDQQLPPNYLDKYSKKIIEHLQQSCQLFTVILYDDDDSITNIVKVYPLITSEEIVKVIYDEFYDYFNRKTDEPGIDYEELCTHADMLYRLTRQFVENGLLETSTYHPFPYYEQGFDNHPDVGTKGIGEPQENGLFELANYSLNYIKNELMTEFKAKYSLDVVYRIMHKEMKIMTVSNKLELNRPSYN